MNVILLQAGDGSSHGDSNIFRLFEEPYSCQQTGIKFGQIRASTPEVVWPECLLHVPQDFFGIIGSLVDLWAVWMLWFLPRSRNFVW